MKCRQRELRTNIQGFEETPNLVLGLALMADSLHQCPHSVLPHSSAALPGAFSVSGQTTDEHPFLWTVATGHVRSCSLEVQCVLSEFLLPGPNFAYGNNSTLTPPLPRPVALPCWTQGS